MIRLSFVFLLCMYFLASHTSLFFSFSNPSVPFTISLPFSLFLLFFPFLEKLINILYINYIYKEKNSHLAFLVVNKRLICGSLPNKQGAIAIKFKISESSILSEEHISIISPAYVALI